MTKTQTILIVLALAVFMFGCVRFEQALDDALARMPRLDRCITVAAFETRGDGTQAVVLSGPKGCAVQTLTITGSKWDFEHGGTPVIAIKGGL